MPDAAVVTPVTGPQVCWGSQAGTHGGMKLLDAILDFDAALDWPLEDEDLDLAYQPSEPAVVEATPA